MIPSLRVEQLVVRYPGRPEPALDDVSMAANAGEVVGITGRTGAGKSTLCLAAAGLVPRVIRASLSGQAMVGEFDAGQTKPSDLAGQVGIVFSSPTLQLSASKPTVREELAFGLENLAVLRADMDARIETVMDRLGVAHLAEREPLTLSGGEQQRVAIASIVVMGTGVILLDEPAAQLDPKGTVEIAALLREMAADGRAVVVAEHDPQILGATERCLILDRGRVLVAGIPGDALVDERSAAAGNEVPTLVALARACGLPGSQAFDESAISASLLSRSSVTRAGSGAFHLDPDTDSAAELAGLAAALAGSPVAVEVRGLVHSYAGGVEAVRGVNLSIEPGNPVAIVGQNGSGKTTLIKHLNGLLRPTSGSVYVDGRGIGGRLISDLAAQVGFVFQNPDDQLFNSRVDREVGFGPRNLGVGDAEVERLVSEALAMTGLESHRSTNPYDLDISVRKLVALAAVLAMRPSVLVLDEPTMSQDGPGKRRIGGIVDALAAGGHTVIAVTHDMEFAARHFKRIVVMRQGEIALDAPPETAFSADNAALLASTGLRPPPTARIAARLGLSGAPVDARSLLGLIARSGGVA